MTDRYSPQRGCPKISELPDVNVNTGVQSINSETELLKNKFFTVTSDCILSVVNTL